jgi:ATP diphosphatase
MKPSRDIERLIEIMAALRTPGTGCPWDLEQDFASIAPYTIEEAYEVADAIARGDLVDLKDELGDLLLQVVFHARMAQEQGSFAFPDVVEAITTKLIRRHPHVFGDARDLSPAQVKALWGQIKAQEKTDKARARALAGLPEPPEARGVLAGVPTTLPSLTRAWKLQAKASTVGFDWNDARLVLDKIREETAEIDEALAGGDKAAIKEEIGDLLFVIANLARHVDADPEACLTAANAKF